MRTVLTIAGSDSSGGAGIQADLKTFAAFGVYGTSAITAITAQSTVGVTAVAPLDGELVTAQIEAVAGDIALHATKTGMLATAAIVETVVAAIEALDLPMVVVDPVLASTSGRALLDSDGITALKRELLPHARVVTPNIPEAEILSGIRIASPEDARTAALRIQELGVSAVIITGGHARGSGEVVDVVLDGETIHECRAARVTSAHTHGTGCTFASAVAACLALGTSLPEAAARAQQFVAGAIRHGIAIGHGSGPVDQFWQRTR